jgi:hypothetical protein
LTTWRRAPERVAGVWRAYRHTDQRFQPLWYGGGTTSLRQEPGRWHEQGVDVAQYLSLSANGAWAERCRYASIRDDVRRLQETRMLWELQVVEHDVADLSSFDRYVACGLDPELAIGPHARCWPLGADLRAAGYRGILSPSAAYDRPDAVNLTLFGERLEDHHYATMPDPSANPRPDLFIPVLLIADAGAPTRHAMLHTCYRAADHRTFANWRATSGVCG